MTAYFLGFICVAIYIARIFHAIDIAERQDRLSRGQRYQYDED